MAHFSVSIEELEIENYNSDYEYMINEVDTKLAKEVHNRNIILYVDGLYYVDYIKSDINLIRDQVERRISNL